MVRRGVLILLALFFDICFGIEANCTSPAVSVIVPVYNSELYLRRCLDSLVNQSLKRIEIICVDDGSVDGSLNILNEYAKRDSRIIVLSQKNKGPSATRNAGMKIATGKYIGFIDSDDWVDLNFFEELYSAAEKYSADIACASAERMYQWGIRYQILFVGKEQVLTSANEKFLATLVPLFSYVWNKIYRRDVLQKLNLQFQEEVREWEDIDFSINALYYMPKLVTVPSICYYYWENPGSITKNIPQSKQPAFRSKRLDAIKFLRKRGIPCLDNIWPEKMSTYSWLGITFAATVEWQHKIQFCFLGAIFTFPKKNKSQ